MMQVGIFTGYFPYGLEETAKKIRGARLQHRAARPAFQGRRSLAPARSPRTRRRRSATRSATTTCRSAASPATPTSSIRTRRERDKRVGYLKEIIRNARHFGTPYVISETGTYNTESDWVRTRRTRPRRASRSAARSSPTWRRPPTTTARCSCSKPTSTMSSAPSRRR